MIGEAEMKGIAGQALNLALTDLRGKRDFIFLLACWSERTGLRRLAAVEETILQRLGEDWLGNGRKKDIGFGLLRVVVDAMPPEVIVFVSPVNRYEATEKFWALPEAVQDRVRDGDEPYDKLAREGFFIAMDCICAVAQTPELVVSCLIEKSEQGELKRPEYRAFPQSGFSGRMKMFGKEPDDRTENDGVAGQPVSGMRFQD